MDAKAMFEDLIARGESTVEAMHALYDQLEPIEPAFLFGAWAGDVVRTGHPGEAQLGGMRWAGKEFHGEDDVDPIVTLDEQGRRQVNPVMGKASIRVVRYRGVATATMVYDKHPIFDHFRKVDDERVLGVMDRKGDAAPLFFHLRRLPRSG